MNARCVWAGQVRLAIRAGKSERVEIGTDKPARLGGGLLELVEVSPDKVAGSRNQGAIPTSQYRFERLPLSRTEQAVKNVVKRAIGFKDF